MSCGQTAARDEERDAAHLETVRQLKKVPLRVWEEMLNAVDGVLEAYEEGSLASLSRCMDKLEQNLTLVRRPR